MQDRQPFAMAGLWSKWPSPDGSELLSFTILTTSPNKLLKPIHDRMPVILDQGDEEMWLDPSIRDIEKLKGLLAPFRAGSMYAYEVSRTVNSPRNDSPECLESVN